MIWNRFWRLWLQKVIKNLSSMKFQWMLLLYIPVIYGMFSGEWVENKWISKITPEVGLTFLGGGFVTLAGTRLYAKTRIQEPDDLTKEIKEED